MFVVNFTVNLTMTYKLPSKLSNWKNDSILILDKICHHQDSKPFIYAVDEIKDDAPNYKKIIPNPMDLTTLRLNIETGVINTPFKFTKDLYLIWLNAQKYNQSAHHPIHKAAKRLHLFSKALIQSIWCEKPSDIFIFYHGVRKSNRNKSKFPEINPDISIVHLEDESCVPSTLNIYQPQPNHNHSTQKQTIEKLINDLYVKEKQIKQLKKENETLKDINLKHKQQFQALSQSYSCTLSAFNDMLSKFYALEKLVKD